MNGGSRTERARLWADVYLALFGDDSDAGATSEPDAARESGARNEDSDETG